LGATLSQLVIAWTVRQPQIDFVLCGARTPSNAIENAKAGQIELTPEVLQAIDLAIENNLGNLIS
ncbi:MAG: aldo/keto reductase, partial [Halocynthiibacter sp.]